MRSIGGASRGRLYEFDEVIPWVACVVGRIDY